MPILEENKEHMIIKRSGKMEKFDKEKLYKVILWACNNNNKLADSIYNNFSIKIGDKMPINELFDELIKTTAFSMNSITPILDEVAKKLFVLKIYKETYNLKRIGNYPSFSKIIQIGLKNNIYSEKILREFDEYEIEELSNAICPDRDLLFNYKGINLFFDKYCKNYMDKESGKMIKLELPQMTYMAAAMHSFYNTPHKTVSERKKRIKNIIKEYDALSNHILNYSTPRLSFGLTDRAQFASCVLIDCDDNTESLIETISAAALYSKFMGGISINMSKIRSRGSVIHANNGRSDGPIPFIKWEEQTVSSFNQQGKRMGSAIISFPWWHMDAMDMIMLKDAGGTEEQRARKNKYAILINDIFLEKVILNEYITLFDPKEVPELNETYGEEFRKYYAAYEKNGNCRSKRINARDVIYTALKIRKETGNLYITFLDNINEQNVTDRYVGFSNLCQEITVPARHSVDYSNYYVTDENNNFISHSVRKNGEIGLCNLTSVNIEKFTEMNECEKNSCIYNLEEGMDNVIDSQYYPVKEGKISNILYRPIGIGTTGYANLLAKNKIKFTDEKAMQFTLDVYDDFYYKVYYNSMLLAREKGPFHGFKESRWAEGLTPYHLSIFRKNNPFDLKFNDDKWNELGELIKQFGVRFSLHASIPPGATSSKVTNTSEGVEPVNDLFYIEAGTYNLPTVVKNLKEWREYYQRCWDIPAHNITVLAAIRQVFLDQAQSFNHYYKDSSSATELLLDILEANMLGVKTLYYMKSPKNLKELECDSCAV